MKRYDKKTKGYTDAPEAKGEDRARSTFPGLSFASRKANKDIVLFGLLLDEQRYTNKLLSEIANRVETL
jgi:hypothetical protein